MKKKIAKAGTLRPAARARITGPPSGPQGSPRRYRIFEQSVPGGLPGGGKPDGGPLSDDALPGAPFLKLDSDLPLLLLPIRIETRYELSAQPAVLRIRIYPDQVHIDADLANLSAVERDLTTNFWTGWYAAPNDTGRSAAWRTFVGRVGAKRAGYLARTLQPTVGKAGALTFPKPNVPPVRTPAHPVLLPRQWLAIGYVGGAQIFLKASAPVARDLRTGPDPAAPAVEVSGSGLTVDDGLAWMIDYARAERVGMAITVPLTGTAAAARHNVDVLLVLGVDEQIGTAAAASELARLLDVHSRTTGLAFVPQGTPTNNTESVAAGWVPQEVETDTDALASRQLGLPKAPPSDSDDNASRLAAALGLADTSTLRRIAYGADLETVESQDMRAVAFEAVMGTFLRQMLDVGAQDGVTSSTTTAVRRWFIDHVTGGAPIPTIRVGPQPYGILPVRRSATQPNLATTAGQVERMVALLIDVWRRSADQLPTLDSNQTDVGGEGDVESAVATILASQPHPARLIARHFEEYIADSTPFSPQPLYQTLLNFMDAAMTASTYKSGLTEAGVAYHSTLNAQYRTGFETIDDQIDVWNQVAGQLEDQLTGDARKTGLDFVQDMLDVLGAYEERQRPLRWLGLDRFEGVLGATNTRLVAGLLYFTAGEWGDIGLVQGPDAASTTAAEYLRDLRSRFHARTSVLTPTSLSNTLSPKPLLYQLLDGTLHLVPKVPDTTQRVQKALERLAPLDPARLEWLLRETLGLGANRLDAWATSLASERLDRLRATRSTGVNIGAFGWVVDLKPREQPGLSGGFIHAPSMTQATTGALLRAGWLAHGTDDPSSPVAVDLRSYRVRTAEWLLEGVRQGQLLGDLLGYRFERSLHDLDADDQIRPVRQIVLAADGRPGVSPDRPVDGIALVELFRAGQLGVVTEKVTQALEDLEAAFDAVNDVTLFESVHQLAIGNNERATAMLDAMSVGAIAPPELRATRTPRSAVSVEHRVVILLDPAAASPDRGWSPGIRDAIAPALEPWVASLVPRADEVGFTAAEILADGPPGSPVGVTLAALQLSALDAVYLVGNDPGAVPPAISTLVAGALGTARTVRIDPASAGGARLSLADFCVMATELRRLVETLRPADARDLRPASALGEPDVDPTAALDAIAALTLDADALRDRLNEAIEDNRLADMASAVGRFARLGISNGAAPTDVAAATALQEVAARRMANVEEVKVDAGDRQPGLEARLAALLGQRVPALGYFVVGGAPDGPVVDVTAGPASATDVDDWLDAVSRVRADVGRVATTGLLSELSGASGLGLHMGQYPVAPGEAWAATGLPSGSGRLSIVAVSGPGGPPAVGKKACGLVVDQWSEPVPGKDQVTGVSFQFDAPSNRPPQTWLLAVTPDGERWSLKLVTDTLLETLEWARLRTVGPEDLVDYGRAIPTTFVPGDLVYWPEES